MRRDQQAAALLAVWILSKKLPNKPESSNVAKSLFRQQRCCAASGLFSSAEQRLSPLYKYNKMDGNS